MIAWRLRHVSHLADVAQLELQLPHKSLALTPSFCGCETAFALVSQEHACLIGIFDCLESKLETYSWVHIFFLAF